MTSTKQNIDWGKMDNLTGHFQLPRHKQIPDLLDDSVTPH